MRRTANPALLVPDATVVTLGDGTNHVLLLRRLWACVPLRASNWTAGVSCGRIVVSLGESESRCVGKKWRGGGGGVSLSRPRDKAWPGRPARGGAHRGSRKKPQPLWRATYNTGLCGNCTNNRPTGTEVHAHFPGSPTIGHRRPEYVPDASQPHDRCTYFYSAPRCWMYLWSILQGMRLLLGTSLVIACNHRTEDDI